MHNKEHILNVNSSYHQIKRIKGDLKFFLLIIFFVMNVYFLYNSAPPKKKKKREKKREKLPHSYVLESP